MQHLRRAILKIDSLITLHRVMLYPLALLIVVSASYAWYLTQMQQMNATLSVGGYGAKMIGGRIVLEGNPGGLYDLEQQAAVQDRLLGETPAERMEAYKSSDLYAAVHSGEYAKTGEDLDRYPRLHFYVAPPFVAYLFAPLATLPFLVGVVIWATLTLALLILSLWLIWSLVPNLHRYGFGRVLLTALSTAPAWLLLAVGQDAAISLFLLALGLRLLLSNRDLSAGAVLGLGVFKPHFFILMPVLFVLQRRWRAVGAWTVVAGALASISVVLVGVDGARAYVDLLRSDLYHFRVDIFQAPSMLSLIALVRSLGLASLAPIVGGAAALLLAAGFGSIALKSIGDRGFTLLYAAAILMTVIITPHVLVYDAVILFIPVLILLNEWPKSAAVRLSIVVAYFLTWLFPLHFGIFGVAPLTVVPLTVLLLVARRLLLVDNIRELSRRRNVTVGTGSVQPG